MRIPYCLVTIIVVLTVSPVCAGDGYDWNFPGASNHVSLTNEDGSQPAVAVTPRGDAVLVWSQKYQGNFRLVLAERSMGTWDILNPTAFPIPQQYLLSLAGNNADNASVAISANNDVAVVWRQQTGPGLNDYGIFYADKRNGQWTKPATLNDSFSFSNTQADLAHVAMNDQGDTVVAWQQYSLPSYTKQIFVGIYKAGYYTFDPNWVPQFMPGSWIKFPADLADYISFDGSKATNAEATIDNDGRVAVTWIQTDVKNKLYVVWVRHFDPQTLSWDVPIQLSLPELIGFRPTIVANHRTGELLAAWGGYPPPQGDNLVFKSQPLPIGSMQWSVPLLTDAISIPNYDACMSSTDEHPSAAIDNSIGHKIIAWSQRDPNGFFAGIFMAEDSGGGNWTLPTNVADSISSNPQDKGREPKAAVSNTRYSVITWIEENPNGGHTLFYSEYVDVNGQWQWVHPFTSGNAFSVNSGSQEIWDFDIDLSDRGYGLVAWSQNDAGIFRIFMSERLPIP